ncbi:hypothetical protein [Nostoc sp.]
MSSNQVRLDEIGSNALRLPLSFDAIASIAIAQHRFWMRQEKDRVPG